MYKVEVNNTGDSAFRVRSDDHELIVDTKGKGITPPGALLAALGSCVGVYIKKYCEGAKIALPGFTVAVSGELTKSAPFRFEAIVVAIQLQGASLDERRKTSLIEFLKNCPVHNSLNRDIKIAMNVV